MQTEDPGLVDHQCRVRHAHRREVGAPIPPPVLETGRSRDASERERFVVAREDAVPFLEEKLGQLGLSD